MRGVYNFVCEVDKSWATRDANAGIVSAFLNVSDSGATTLILNGSCSGAIFLGVFRNKLLIYLDESGDTGWSFDRPYGAGGSSRYLVITALTVSLELDHKPARMLRNIYRHRGWASHKEKKWIDMSPEARSDFTMQAAKLLAQHAQMRCLTIVVDKRKVMPHVRRDSNKLYNYMVKLLLLDVMAQQPHVTFIPDPRSIKVESGNSLHDYLQTELWFTKNSSTLLETTPIDSRYCLNLQFADMLAGAIQSQFEFANSRYFDLIANHVRLKKLFF